MNRPEFRKTSAIILAGGQGNRFRGKKQFIEIDGRQMWEYPYAEAVSLLGRDRVKVVGVDVPGGPTRTKSVINGLYSVSADTSRIVIMEAARPLVTADDILQLLADPGLSATLVRPVVSTVSFRDGRPLNRDEIYELLSPQVFDFQLLRAALFSGRYHHMTEQTQVMSACYGICPHYVETTSPLFKVTYPQDVDMVTYLLRQR